MKMTAADREWAQAVKERDNYTCRRCLRSYTPPTKALDAHHIFGRACGTCTGYYTVNGKRVPGWKKPHYCKRLDLDMGITLCVGDHRSWAHAKPWEFHEWIREVMGWKDYDALRLRSNKTKVSA